MGGSVHTRLQVNTATSDRGAVNGELKTATAIIGTIHFHAEILDIQTRIVSRLPMGREKNTQ